MRHKNSKANMRREKVMAMQWNKDANGTLAEAKATAKPLLVDFSAAPA
jgi:hypothetical protein